MIRYLIKNNMKLMLRSMWGIAVMLTGPILVVVMLSNAFSALMSTYEGVDEFTAGLRGTEAVQETALYEAVKQAGEEAGIIFCEYPQGEIQELMQKALKNGASGYLIKNHTPEHLKQMIVSVYNGTGVMEEALLENLAKNVTDKSTGFCGENYTAREMDIVKALAEGLSNREIAKRLFITEGTVKNYITSILAKEGLSHRTALAVYYLTGQKPEE